MKSDTTDFILQHDQGANVVGWDLEWHTDWNKYPTGHSYGHWGVLMRLLTLPTQMRDKIVILTHEFMYYEHKEDGKRDAANLESFIRYAKELGYEFRTIDTYVTDDPSAENDEGNDYELTRDKLTSTAFQAINKFTFQNWFKG